MVAASRITNFARNVQGMFKPKSLISLGVKDDFYDVSTDTLERVKYEDLEKLYLKDPMVFSGINLFSQACLGKGNFVESENKKSKELCEKILKLNSWRPSFLSAITNTLVYGVGFQEIVWSGQEDEEGEKKKKENGQEIVGFRTIDPKSMTMKWDEHGIITSYAQKMHGIPKVIFKPYQIAFYKFFQIADGNKGIGFLEPIVDDLEIKQDMENSIKELIHKFGYPPMHVVRKGERDPNKLAAMQKKMKNIRRQSLFVTNENTEIKAIEVARQIPNLSFYVDMIMDNIACGLRVPKPFLLERGESINRATAFALMDMNSFEISLIQEKLTSIIEDQIFRPACLKQNVPVADNKWHPLKTEDEQRMANVIRTQISTISEAVKAGLIDNIEGQALLIKMLDRNEPGNIPPLRTRRVDET